MNVQSIGENAGIVWKQLASEHRKWEYAEVKAATGLADRDLNAAIGWLARESKIFIRQKDNEIWVSEKPEIMFSFG